MDSSSDEEELLLLVALAEDEEENRRRQRKRRRLWIHEINATREEQGEFYTLVPQLTRDEKRFYIYFRMTTQCFDEILGKVRKDITKQHTNWRRPIPPEERLAITIRFLVTGGSIYTIGHSFRVGFSTVSAIVMEVCAAIWENMRSEFMPEPSRRLWENCAQRFDEIWGFPNCVGAIDAKQFTIKCPDNVGSAYFSYLKKHSIVLLAIVGPEYEFLCVDVGGYGRNSDEGIFEQSLMGQRFDREEFDLPDDKALPGEIQPTPHVLAGDQAFGLKKYMMRPFPYEQSKDDLRKDTFNTRLCQARKVVENAFGILTMKFRIFLRPIKMKVENISLFTSTACLLHNFVRLKRCDDQYLQALMQEEPVEGEMVRFDAIQNPRAANVCYQIRDKFAAYFSQVA